MTLPYVGYRWLLKMCYVQHFLIIALCYGTIVNSINNRIL